MYLAKQSMFGTSLQKFIFQNDLPDLDSLVQIKNRDNLRVLNCSEPNIERNGRDAFLSRGGRGRLQFLATLLGT